MSQWDDSLWFSYLSGRCWTGSVNHHHLLGFLLQPFFPLCRSLCLLISHIFAQDGECCRDEKENLLLLSCPRSPPLTQLSTLQRGGVKQTAVQTPQIITQESHWERCVGSGCDSVCAPVFTGIHLHMSRPQPIRSHGRVFGFGFGLINSCLW